MCVWETWPAVRLVSLVALPFRIAGSRPGFEEGTTNERETCLGLLIWR